MQKGDLVRVVWAGKDQLGVYLRHTSDQWVVFYSAEAGVSSAPSGAVTVLASGGMSFASLVEQACVESVKGALDRWIPLQGSGSWLVPAREVKRGDVVWVSRARGPVVSVCLAIVIEVQEYGVIVGPPVVGGGPYGIRHAGELYEGYNVPGSNFGLSFVEQMVPAV